MQCKKKEGMGKVRQSIGKKYQHTVLLRSSNDFYLWMFCTQVGEDGSVVTSVAVFTPRKEDDQKFVSCQARNPLIEDIAVEDQWKITVYCEYRVREQLHLW